MRVYSFLENGKNRKNKRKNRNSSGDNENVNSAKLFKQRGPSQEEESVTVSGLLSQVNAALYNGEGEQGDEIIGWKKEEGSVFRENSDENRVEPKETESSGAEMAESSGEPSNRDIMNCLQRMGTMFESRLEAVEKKLVAVEKLEQKVSGFEKELKGIWVALEDRTRKVEDRVSKIGDKADNTELETGVIASRVMELEQERDRLREDLVYLKSQSMRNNLVFTNIPEEKTNGNEATDVTEKKLRQHLHEVLKLAKETAESIRFERVHRSPGEPVQGRNRSVVAKFTFFQDRELVRRQWRSLQGTPYSMYEQFPPEVVARRKKLMPKMREARAEGKRAWVAYDTLYVNGRAVRD